MSSIFITEKKNCCGCSACMNSCLSQCIEMIADTEGFIYPHINESQCTKCGLCEKVCHQLHPLPESSPMKALGVYCQNEQVRATSSSGEVFAVNTEYGYAVLFAVSPQLLKDLELLVAQLAICHGQRLHRLAASVALCLDDLPDSIEAYGYMILFIEYLLNLRGAQPQPLLVGILRKPGYVKSHYLAEDGDVLGMDGRNALPAVSLLSDTPSPCLLLYLWIICDLHNCLEFSCKGTDFSTDSQF